MSDVPKSKFSTEKQQLDTGWHKFTANFISLNDGKALTPLITQLSHHFDKTFKFVGAKNNFAAYCVDLSAVKINLSINTLVCFIKTKNTSIADAFRFIVDNYHAERQQGYTSIVILDEPNEQLEQRFHGHPARILFLQKRHLYYFFATSDWQYSLASLLTENSENIDILSPYDENGVCSPELFYGRDQELDVLYRRTTTHCHALVGCRRVGKTSLMLDIKRRCEQFGENTYYIDFQNCQNELEFLETLIRVTRRKDLKNMDAWTVSEYLIRLANFEGPVVNLFLDEMDSIVLFDKKQKYKLIKELVMATQAGGKKQIKIWIAGFKELYWAIADRYGPLYNKMSAKVIGPLEQIDAEKLITTPITQLGLKFESEQAQIDYIAAITNNHPGFLQLFCRLLIKELANTKKTIITMEHLKNVRRHPDLLDYVRDYFAINTTVLEKIIVLSVIELKTFTQEMVADTLITYAAIKLEYKPLYKELRDLRFGGIFSQTGEIFSFQFPLLAEVLKASANYIKQDVIEKARNTAKKVNASNN